MRSFSITDRLSAYSIPAFNNFNSFLRLLVSDFSVDDKAFESFSKSRDIFPP